MKMKSKKKILIATGGTGGHVFPAYSLAKDLIKKKYDIFTSTDLRGYKYLKNFPELNLQIINSATIYKKNLISAFFSFFVILFSIMKSIFYLLKIKPNLIFGMGGYSSFPICISAKLLKIPFIIYENNLVIGKANNHLLPFAEALFVSYSSVEGIDNKYREKTFEIGNIIRQEILNYSHDKIENSKDINFLVLGGSQAAKIFAEKLPDIFRACKKNKISIKIFQQCLPEQVEKLKKDYASSNIESEIFSFKYNLVDYFSKIDVAITRSGSSMLAELLNCNIPIISIPLKSAADNHQLKNAKYFEKNGYGVVIEEDYITKDLFTLIKAIHEDKDILNKIKINQKNYSDKEVFKKIESHIFKLLND